MLFSELYSAYYHTVAIILRQALVRPVTGAELQEIVAAHAFGESILRIPPALTTGQWSLLHADGTAALEHPPTMPLTTLQKRWLKAISLDPRIRLFVATDECDTPEPAGMPKKFDTPEPSVDLKSSGFPDLDDVEPLFTPDDYVVFDRYADGDNYEDETYIANFRQILDAIRSHTALQIDYTTRKGNPVRHVVLPESLEYSEKDDKFRLIASGDRFWHTINLGRITACRPCEAPWGLQGATEQSSADPRHVVFELYDRRNALERVLLHFAHFRKEAENLQDNHYRVTLYYDRDDETEILIRLLSFGPMVKVIAPERFVDLIKERLLRQKHCGR